MWALISKTGDHICMQPRRVLGIPLHADTAYVGLTQVMRATAGLAAPSHAVAWLGVPPQAWGRGGGQEGGWWWWDLLLHWAPCGHQQQQQVPLPTLCWRWGLCQQSAWTFLLHLTRLPVRLQRLNQAWILLFTQRQCTSQKAIASVLFSFPHAYQKSNSVMWLMGLYWPTSAVAINICRNSQMPQPQWQYSCLPVFLLPNRSGSFYINNSSPNFAPC